MATMSYLPREMLALLNAEPILSGRSLFNWGVPNITGDKMPLCSSHYP